MGSTPRFAVLLILGLAACATTPVSAPPYQHYNIRPKIDSKGKLMDSLVTQRIAAQSRDLLRCYFEKPTNAGKASVESTFEIGSTGAVMYAEVKATSEIPNEDLAPCIRGALLGLRFEPTGSNFAKKVFYSFEIEPAKGVPDETLETGDLGPIAEWHCEPVSCIEPPSRADSR